MVAFTLTNVPAFMGALLSHETFDAFGVHEITIRNGFNLIIEEGQTLSAGEQADSENGAQTVSGEKTGQNTGKPEPGAGGSDAAENALLYARVRPLCFDAVKGKVLPSFMRFVLTAPAGTAERLAAALPDSFDPANVLSLAVNLTYKGGTLTVTSGSSVKDIFAGKAADTAWGEEVKRLFSSYGIEE